MIMNKKDNEMKREKKPWPTKDVMEQIYELNLWGGEKSDYYSGAGSHDPDIVDPYIEAVKSFLTSMNSELIVCDLGCGDFNIGRQLVDSTKKYVAVDIVSSLIERNKEKFKNANLEFQCLDLAEDDLPSGDCVLLRQVLQHLSNDEVKTIVSKLTSFKYLILTEHIPSKDFEPNKEIISGQGIRLRKQSGLDLLAPPFNLKVKKESELTSTTLADGNSIIVTMLYELF